MKPIVIPCIPLFFANGILALVLCTACSSKAEHKEPLQTKSELFKQHDKSPVASPAYLYHSGSREQLGLELLEQGINSRDKSDVLLSLYGIGLSNNDNALALTERAITCQEPELQLAAVQVLASNNTEEANQLLLEALKSDFLLVRLEALYSLCIKKHPNAYPNIEALYAKVPNEFHQFFPELLALDGSPESIQMLRKLIRDQDIQVAIASCHELGKLGREEFLPDIISQLHNPSPAMQEAIAGALTRLPHERCIDALKKIAASNNLGAITAATALHDTDIVEEAAAYNNLYAITLLGKLGINNDLLAEKCEHSDLQIRTNATIALLEQKDKRVMDNSSLPFLLIKQPNDLVFERFESPGKTLYYYKATPSGQQHLKDAPYLYETSLRIREQLLIQAAELPEELFLQLAQGILESEQHDLIPITIHLLENIRSKASIALLRAESQHLGSPFIRTYCHLALFRMHEEPATFLLEFIRQNKNHDILQTRAILPWQLRPESSQYALTLEEKSRLLVEAYEALALSQKEEAQLALLDAVKTGNPHNRYLLAGLLLRSSN